MSDSPADDRTQSGADSPALPTPAIIERLYDVMERELGPTGWWPAETLFEIMVGAVLTQNTAWGNVERSLANINAAGMLEPAALAVTDDARLQELIRPSGFYRNKSRAIRSLSRWYVERCDADPARVAGVGDADLRDELLELFGIGGETADDLMLYVFGRRTFVADTYARRLFRFLGFTAPDGYAAFRNAYQPIIAATALDVAQLQEFHGLIDEYGKRHRDDAAKSSSFLAGFRIAPNGSR